MEPRTSFQTLDPISLCQILSFLGTSDIAHLSQTCKAFHQIISTSPHIAVSLFENLFGRKMSKKEASNLTYSRFQEVLRDLSLHEPLPFFGFRGNCGCYSNSLSCLFDKIFEYKEERSIICSNFGENIDIEGVLSEDYAREKKHTQNIISTINEMDPDENPDLYEIKDRFERYGSWTVDHFNLPSNTPAEQEIKALRELRMKASIYLKNRKEKYHIELSCQKMMKSVGLIQSCHFKRETTGLTCPVKTVAAFASLNQKIGSSSLSALFRECKTSDDLIQLLSDHKNELPSISQTSIKKIAESCPKIKYINEEEDGVEFVVFNSNGKKQEVIPLFWVNFNKPVNKDLFLSFKGCNLSGRYVMLKLIQCEDLISSNHPKNIDFGFCCLYGSVLNL